MFFPLSLLMLFSGIHNPISNWVDKRLDSWTTSCSKNCLHSTISKFNEEPSSPEDLDLSEIPPCYHNLKQVFSKQWGLSLPPHRPYNCVIDLLLGGPLPSSRLYNLLGLEKETVKKYIEDSSTSGIIRPSTTPMRAGFFFVEKKDKKLRPCIDYRGLIQITIKKKYPLPLTDSAFEQFHSVTVFTKLDFFNAYQLVRIWTGDEWKTAFKTPLGHLEYMVMPFGLTDALAVFQALVNNVLRDFLNVFVFVYWMIY